MLKRSHGSAEFVTWLSQPSPPASEPMPPTDPRLPVLVVGAGPAGLAAMDALREAGVNFECVESHDQLGGIWNQTNPTSTVYDGLRTVTSRYTSYLGPPIPLDWPFYPSHEQVLKYFIECAESQGLISAIRFSTRFETATRSPHGTWIAKLRRVDRQEIEQREVRAVVIATGAHTKRHRSIPQSLWDEAVAAGLETIHSADYKSPTAFAGKRVLVVGIGASGSDIAEKISSHAARTLLAIRTDPWVIPQTLGGVPCDKLGAEKPNLPDWMTLGYFHAARWLVIGGFRRLGWSRPRHGINDCLPVADRGIVRALHDGRVMARSNVVSVTGKIAQFADPRHPSEPIDAVIFATGYKRQYPIFGDIGCTNDALLFHLFDRREPGLACMTELVGFRSCWPIFVEQARAIAAYFAAEQRGSVRVAEFNVRRGLPSPSCKGKLFRRANQFHLDYDLYAPMLRDFTHWLSAAKTADSTLRVEQAHDGGSHPRHPQAAQHASLRKRGEPQGVGHKQAADEKVDGH